jgi:hypothetical protein
MPWLDACGLEGSVKLLIRPPQELQNADRWRVVLHFCEISEPAPARTFDVKLQGKTVLRSLNVAATSGGVRRGMTKAFSLDNEKTVTLELSRAVATSPPPIISGLEIVSE